MQPFVKEIWDVKAFTFLLVDVIKIQRSIFHIQDVHIYNIYIYKEPFKQACLKRSQKPWVTRWLTYPL